MNRTSNGIRLTLPSSLAFYLSLSIVFSLCFVHSAAYGQDYSLPLYRLTIADRYLASLEADPWSPTEYPGEVEYEGQTYNCAVRFRGASARDLPKHSWKLKFTDDSPLNYTSVNLDAEYRDLSQSRDYFAARLAIDAGMQASQMRHVSLIVNEMYYGVYLETEPVDKSFFERRDVEISSLFFTAAHPARFAPITVVSAFVGSYELEEREPNAYDSLASLINKVYHSSSERFAEEIERWLDVDAFLRYFALQFVIANYDGFSKNQHLARLRDGRVTVVLWDCDATFGNVWTGEWVNHPELLRFEALESNVVINRLIRVPEYRNRFRELIQTMGGEGFARLDSIIHDEFELIRNDVYLDTMKQGTNESFDQEEAKIRTYLSQRSGFLNNIGDRFRPESHLSWRVEPDYLSDQADSIFFGLQFARRPTSAAVEIHDQTGQILILGLMDNGALGDEAAGDGLYSTKDSFADLTAPLHFFYRVVDDSGGSYPYPWGGFELGQNSIFDIPAVHLDANPPAEGSVGITPLEEILESSTRSVGLINRTENPINLSDCSVVLDDVRRCRLPELQPVEPGDTLFVTNHLEYSRMSYPSRRWTGGYFFSPLVNDSIILESPGGRRLAASVLARPLRLSDPPSRVVINEINYNCSREFNCGDWIELTALSDEVDISGWMIQDGEANNYSIPEGVTISPGEYLTFAADTEKFSEVWPEAAFIGGFAFSFSNGGDEVRLCDRNGNPVDWVAYDDNEPWPNEADGDGATLELVNPELSNYGHDNWEASRFPAVHGTPGSVNHAYQGVKLKSPTMISSWEILSLSPNPFNGALQVRIHAPVAGRVKLAVYDLAGRKASEMSIGLSSAGVVSVNWSDNALSFAPTGLYFVRIEEPTISKPSGVILLK